MFFVGLEVDLRQFSANWFRSLVFGLLTFALSRAAGTTIGVEFGYDPIASILIGSQIASHTLIAYPMVEASHRVTRPPSVPRFRPTSSLPVLTMCVTTLTRPVRPNR